MPWKSTNFIVPSIEIGLFTSQTHGLRPAAKWSALEAMETLPPPYLLMKLDIMLDEASALVTRVGPNWTRRPPGHVVSLLKVPCYHPSLYTQIKAEFLPPNLTPL